MSTRPWFRGVLVGLMLLVVAAMVVGADLVVHDYGGDSFFPGLVAGFIGTFLAFVLALWSEGVRERLQLKRDADRLEESRKSEIQRRLKAVDAELDKNAESLEIVVSGLDPVAAARSWRAALGSRIPAKGPVLLMPQLLDRAWAANAPRLAALVADYELIADLSTTYGRIEELRWRLRLRAEWARDARFRRRLDTMTLPLAEDLTTEVADLRARVQKAADDPHVQTLGLLHTVTATAAVSRAVAGMPDVIRVEGGAISLSAQDPG